MKAILHNIRSIHNVGSMFRTADAAGIEKLYLTGITPAPVDEWGKARPQLTKVSLGAEKTVAWEKHASATKLIKKLKKDDYVIVAIEQHKYAIPLADFYHKNIHNAKIKLYNKISGRYFYCTILERRLLEGRKEEKWGSEWGSGGRNVVLIMGNEVRGLSPAVLKLADHIVEIPMRGKKESLNVAVAFGVAAYWFLF